MSFKTKNNHHRALLLVANWDSGTGYAWWLMESFWTLLADDCSAKGQDVLLVYPAISKIPASISESEIIVHQLDFSKNDLLSIYRQCKFVLKHDVGTIYLSDYSSCSLKYLILRLIGIKHIIVHEHAPGIREVPGYAKLLIKKLIHRLPLICASGLIATTEYVRRRHIDVLGMPEDRCYCATNGLPVQPASQPTNLFDEYGIPENRKVMVTTGRANKYKGVDFALDVLAQLVVDRHEKNIHYIFCGDGPDLEAFKSTAKSLGVQDHVTFTGHLDAVFPCLEACDFAFHPSRGEVGYSLSILEYMQAGLPVIVPDNPSVCGATIDGVTGYIYKEHDLSDAVAKINKFLTDPLEVGIMGKQARQHVLEEYRLENTHDQLLRAISTIVAS